MGVEEGGDFRGPDGPIGDHGEIERATGGFRVALDQFGDLGQPLELEQRFAAEEADADLGPGAGVAEKRKSTTRRAVSGGHRAGALGDIAVTTGEVASLRDADRGVFHAPAPPRSPAAPRRPLLGQPRAAIQPNAFANTRDSTETS